MPFGQNCEYADFAACVAANQDKDSPDGYCATLQAATEAHCKGDSMDGAERQEAARRRAQFSVDNPGLQARALRTAPTGIGASRSLAFPAQLRAKKTERNGQQLYHVNGIASATDTPYEMWDVFGPYEETIDGRAFDVTLAADPDVAFLVNHRGVTMARHRPGVADTEQTLLLGMTGEGLNTDAWLNPKRQDVSDLIVAIDDKNVTEMSFAFQLDEGWWSDDFTTFKITKVNLDRGDVSAVNYGANPYTNIAARSPEILAELDHLPLGAARAALVRLQARQDLMPPVVTRTAEKTGRSLAMIEALLEDDDED